MAMNAPPYVVNSEYGQAGRECIVEDMITMRSYVFIYHSCFIQYYNKDIKQIIKKVYLSNSILFLCLIFATGS